jgi:hypothetical protein
MLYIITNTMNNKLAPPAPNASTVLKILNKGGTIDAIYLDFMKAFDTVPHKRFIWEIEELRNC